MNQTEQRDLGKLEARMDNVETDIGEMKKDVRAIRDVIVQAKGSWRTLVILAGLSAAAGAFATKLLAWLAMLPR